MHVNLFSFFHGRLAWPTCRSPPPICQFQFQSPSLTPRMGVPGAEEQQRQRRRLREVVDEEPSGGAAHLVIVGPPPVEQVPLRGHARGMWVQSAVVRGQQLFRRVMGVVWCGEVCCAWGAWDGRRYVCVGQGFGARQGGWLLHIKC